MAIPLEVVQRLPWLRQLTIPAEYEDWHGHMRVTHHLQIHDDSRLPFVRLMAVDETYFSERRMGFPILESHLRFLTEVHVGDRVAVHVRFPGRSPKAMHTLWFLVNLSRKQVANTLGVFQIHVDLDQRRPKRFPEDVALALDQLIAEHASLNWAAPLSGCISVAEGARRS